MANYYEILGVTSEAAPQEIKKAYFALAKKYHPDTSALAKSEAEAKMSALNEAYAVLSDEGQRMAYNKEYVDFSKEKQQDYAYGQSQDYVVYADSQNPQANEAYHIANLHALKHCQEYLAIFQYQLVDAVEAYHLGNLWFQFQQEVEYTVSRLLILDVLEPATADYYGRVILLFAQNFLILSQKDKAELALKKLQLKLSKVSPAIQQNFYKLQLSV